MKEKKTLQDILELLRSTNKISFKDRGTILEYMEELKYKVDYLEDILYRVDYKFSRYKESDIE